MDIAGRHRRRSAPLWTVVLASALFGVVFGASGVIVAGGAASPSAQPVTADAAPPSTTASPSTTAPPPPTSASVEPPPEATHTVRPLAFAEPTTSPDGLSLTVLPPEKVKGGVLLTIALANTANSPITVDTGALGPHDPLFDDVAVPMTMSPAKKKLVPGEGYTYQCTIKLPTMDVGDLAFGIGPVTVTGRAAGD